MSEDYYTLKGNQSIKEGQYKLFMDDFICQMGNYKKNKRSGIWYIMSYMDGIDIVYNYDSQELIDFEKMYYISYEDSTLRKPIYLGGMKYFMLSIKNLINCNQTLLGDKYLRISFDVDSCGIPSNFKVKLSCDIKALNLMSLDAVKKVATSDFKFLPAQKNGRAVSDIIEVQITYDSMRGIDVAPYN